ncbi:hypothetical protein F5B17DRAFT_414001 [Nemania serpens]|nr:hypothetical protein F5B17DRAFT_414001 [Nemania serpens]
MGTIVLMLFCLLPTYNRWSGAASHSNSSTTPSESIYYTSTPRYPDLGDPLTLAGTCRVCGSACFALVRQLCYP